MTLGCQLTVGDNQGDNSLPYTIDIISKDTIRRRACSTNINVFEHWNFLYIISKKSFNLNADIVQFLVHLKTITDYQM